MEPLSRLEELRRKHGELDRRISEEESYPGSNDLRIREMKREKLRLREQIEEIRIATEERESPSN